MIIFTSAATDFEVNHTPLVSLVFPRRRMTNYGTSELLQDVFGKEKNPLSAWCMAVANLPLGTPVELAVIFELVVRES